MIVGVFQDCRWSMIMIVAFHDYNLSWSSQVSQSTCYWKLPKASETKNLINHIHGSCWHYEYSTVEKGNHDNADVGDLIMKIMIMMVMPKTTSQTTLSAAVVGPRSTSARWISKTISFLNISNIRYILIRSKTISNAKYFSYVIGYL